MTTNQVDPRKWLTVAEISDVQQAGEQAALSGQHPSACPYRNTTMPADLARRQVWVAGYAAGRTELRRAHTTVPDEGAPC
jgi:ribosome modulation factor